jgi:hypothetical protein
MKKYEVLYDWPVTAVGRLADSNEAEAYAEGLEAVPLASFTTLTERMRGLGAELAAAKAARIHFAKWVELRQCVEEFEQQFANFPDASLPKFRLSILLAEKIAQIAPPLDAADIDENTFEIRELPRALPFAWFARENGPSLADSIAIFKCDDLISLETEIAAWNLSPTFSFHLLATLHTQPVLPLGHAVLAKRDAPQIEIAAVEAFARMLVLMTGKPVHAARRYLNAPQVLDPDAIRAGNVYQQWGEILDVLSDYNSRDELLLKYLTIYHVMENFMFKLPIVGLERERNGKMFSIRDFQSLYDKTKMKEGDALRRLFTVIFEQEALPGVTFEQHISARWAALAPGIPEADIDGALQALGLPFAFAQFGAQSAVTSFAKLVYAIRNAIVHNKETEFHLTYASLDMTISALIEMFLIPSLEEICFSLIGIPNTHLWYQNKQLLLYK